MESEILGLFRCASEVEHLIQALKAADKKFEHKVYQNAPALRESRRKSPASPRSRFLACS